MWWLIFDKMENEQKPDKTNEDMAITGLWDYKRMPEMTFKFQTPVAGNLMQPLQSSEG